jgi:hypothetical protein
MIRRILRIFGVVGLVVLVGAAVTPQFKGIYSSEGRFTFSASIFGWLVAYQSHNVGWRAYTFEQPEVNVLDRLHMPGIGRVSLMGGSESETFVFIPWWLLILLWGLALIPLWRLTRKPNATKAFPVEAAKSPA